MSDIPASGALFNKSGSKNIAASNLGFEKKLKAYTATGLHSVSDEKVTSFRITQKIVDDANSKRFDGKWNLAALNDRETWFREQVANLLQIEII